MFNVADLKVDVHRKNSSESSEEVALRPVVQKVSVLRAEQCTQPEGEAIRVKIQGQFIYMCSSFLTVMISLLCFYHDTPLFICYLCHLILSL